MQIIKHSETVDHIEYALRFNDAVTTGAWYGFPCDEQGNILPNDKYEYWKENLEKCQNGTYKVEAPFVQKIEWPIHHAAIGLCNCNAHVQLSEDVNECDSCGLEYNRCGQLLAPRQYWRDEW